MKTKEHQNKEWKSCWRDEYLKWICGFANADGGVLEIGREDSGEICGVSNVKKLLEDIPNKVRDILGIVVDVNLKLEQDLNYLEIAVDPYPYPISYKGEYHYRSGSTKQELKGAALDKFLLKKQGLHWDGVPIPNFTVSDLSKTALEDFRKKAAKSERLSNEILAESDELLVRKLRLFNNDYLKRAAILLFHEDPEILIGGAYVKIGFFRSNADLLYQDEIHGNLFTQVEQTLDLLLTKYLQAGISYDGLQRLETFPLPKEALREALVNAIAHKDYASSIPIQISVYHDKLMIWNPGQLPLDWTVDNLLQKHESHPYNPDIANSFFRAAYMESWGRGFEKITEACQQASIPLPKIKYERTGLWVEFPFQVEKESSVVAKTSRETSGETSRETSREMTTKQREIIKWIEKDSSITGLELAKRLKISEKGVRFHLRNLKQLGIIERMGSNKDGYWRINSDGL